ncbi:hypothetical protein H6503_01745 [Candidatus Woesearchaeota archaeon]|nr:hypothetical protein [Candidatus Woesearchaeota archaeon]
MRSRKAQGISLTTVVIAALALIVLIILILIFSGRISLFNKGVVDCPNGSHTESNLDNCDGLPVKITEDPANKGEVIYCCKDTTTTANP